MEAAKEDWCLRYGSSKLHPDLNLMQVSLQQRLLFLPDANFNLSSGKCRIEQTHVCVGQKHTIISFTQDSRGGVDVMQPDV